MNLEERVAELEKRVAKLEARFAPVSGSFTDLLDELQKSKDPLSVLRKHHRKNREKRKKGNE